jgi:hypothetical protein
MKLVIRIIIFAVVSAFLYKYYVTDIWTMVQREIFKIYSPTDTEARLIYLHIVNAFGVAIFSLAASIVAGRMFFSKAWLAALAYVVLATIYYLYPYGLPEGVFMQYPLVKLCSLAIFTIIFSIYTGSKCHASYNKTSNATP